MQNSIGNGEAKEVTCMTHGHELRVVMAGRNGGYWIKGTKGKNWDNCNNMINKIFFFLKRKFWGKGRPGPELHFKEVDLTESRQMA